MSNSVQLAEIEALSDRIYDAVADLQSAFPDRYGAGYWVWLNTHGWKDVPALRELLPPIPPKDVYQFSNTSDDWGYLLTAGAIYRAVCRALSSINESVEDYPRLLDFGCGPGRGIRCFLRHSKAMALAGTDVDGHAISWCRRFLPFASFDVNREVPPLRYANGSFDMVLSVSVFSHLAMDIAKRWIAELRRVLRPGGLAIISIHGSHALRRAGEEEEILSMIQVPRSRFDPAVKEFSERGVTFIEQPDGHLSTELYGVTFMDEEFARRVWSPEFRLIRHAAAEIDHWQDVLLLRAE